MSERCSIDGSEHAERALGATVELAEARQIGTVHIVHVISPMTSELVAVADAHHEIEHAYVATLDYERSMGWEMLHEATRRFDVVGFGAVEEHVLVGDPARRITELADQIAADLIVLGRRGLGGFAGIVLGSVTRKIEHAATCPLLTFV